DDAVPIRRETAKIVNAYVQQSLRDGPRHNPFRERPLDHLRKDGHDVDRQPRGFTPRTPLPAHSRSLVRSFAASNPSGGSTTIAFAAGSTFTQILSTIGMSTSPRVLSTTR